MTVMKDFIAFIRGRGIIGFAVGFILGKATSDLIGSFVSDIINPIIGILTGSFEDLSKATINVYSASIKYGNFTVILINFLILTLVVYILAKILKFEKIDKQPDPK